MPFSGGIFTRVHNWVTDRINLIDITDTRMDAEMDGFATGLSNCVLKDGTQTITNDIPMNSKKITGLANGTTTGEAVHFGQTATDALVGLVELADASEAAAGTDTTRALTPATQLVLPISSGTFTTTTNCDIAIPTGFSSVEILIDNLTSSLTSQIVARISTDGGSNYIASNYWYSLNSFISNLGDASTGSSSATELLLLGAVTSGPTAPGSIDLKIPRPSSTTIKKTMLWQSGGHVGSNQYMGIAGAGGYHGGNDDITHIRIFAQAGGTLTFNYRVIGWK